jgi:uncharacterized membrane protein
MGLRHPFREGTALIPIVLLLFLLSVAMGVAIFGWAVRSTGLDVAFVATAAAFLAVLVVAVTRRVGPTMHGDHHRDRGRRP